MSEIIEAYLERNSPLSGSEQMLIRKVLVPSTLKKGEFLVREGVVRNMQPLYVKDF